MTCGLLKWEAGVLTVEGARELFGRDVLIRDVPYEAGEAITCGSFPASELCACGVFAEYLCDYPLGKGKTCDAPLCATHAMPVGGQSAELMRPHDVAMRRDPQVAMRFDERAAVLNDLHYCPAHLEESVRKSRNGG